MMDVASARTERYARAFDNGAAMADQSFAVPRQGYVLSTAADAFGRPVRTAVGLVSLAFQEAADPDAIASTWRATYGTRGPDGLHERCRSVVELAAWASVSNWLVGLATDELDASASLKAAEHWFTASSSGGPCNLVSEDSLRPATELLRGIAAQPGLGDLLPYILDPHGPGSRLSIMREPETLEARERKRAEGVYYTPADVARYMAVQALSGLEHEAYPLTVLDPACGSGVFLRAALDVLASRAPPAARFEKACLCLYGSDVDPWALDAAAYVLTHACRRGGGVGLPSPAAVWHSLRMNLVNVDTLRLDPDDGVQRGNARTNRMELRAKLKAGLNPDPMADGFPKGSVPVTALFPELGQGPRVILGNPPYADVGRRDDFLQLARRFRTFAATPRPSSDVYPLFVEQMVRLTAPESHGGALVLPLSIACNTSPQFAALRQVVSSEPGTWRFAFFDREPHALFGEDVKTRNAIVLWKKHAAEHGVSIHTGPLRKWRGQNRSAMFENIKFTPVSVDLRMGIPKVEGASEATALETLATVTCTLERAVAHIGKASLCQALKATSSSVYVGSTAYNFLNVFPSLLESTNRPEADRLTENQLHALACKTAEDQFALYAALNGNFAYWWWHIQGDGFHVSRYTLAHMPIGAALIERESARRLAFLGETLWRFVSREPIVSKNKGRVSLGFSAVAHDALRRQIDEVLLDANEISPTFAEDLERFTLRVVSAQNFKP